MKPRSACGCCLLPLFCAGILLAAAFIFYHNLRRKERKPIAYQQIHAVQDTVTVAQFAASPSAIDTNLQHVKPVAGIPDHPGIFVCPPTCSTLLPLTVQELGDGFSRWMQLYLAGLPCFSRSPFWSCQVRLSRETGQPSLHLTPASLPVVAQATGCTNAIITSLSQHGTGYQLTAVIYSLPSAKPAAAPLAITGTPDQLTSRLPALAKALATELRARNAGSIPTATGLSSADMEFLGSIPVDFNPFSPSSTAAVHRLVSIADRSPLAAAIALGNTSHPLRSSMVSLPDKLFNALPNNAEAEGIVNSLGSREVIKREPQILKLHQQWKHNYTFAALLAQYSKLSHVSMSPGGIQVKLSRQAALLDPGNPQAWLQLSYVLSKTARIIRKGRYARDISTADWQNLNKIYRRTARIAKRAVETDPLDASAWANLSEADTFNNDTNGAVKALQQAQKLDPADEDNYYWGLQLYQTKWSTGETAEMIWNARHYAAAADYDETSWDAVTALKNDGMNLDAQNLAHAILTANRTSYKNNPQNPLYALSYARALEHDGHDLKAEPILRQLLNGSPYAYNAAYDLGTIAYKHKSCLTAAHYYEQSLALCPDNHKIYVRLSKALRMCGQGALAARYMRARLKDDPFDWLTEQNLGFTDLQYHNSKEAIAVLKASLKLMPQSNAWFNLGLAYYQARQYQKAITACTQDNVYFPNTGESYAVIAASLAGLHKYAEAEKEGRTALAHGEQTPYFYMQYANICFNAGDILNARKYWQLCANNTSRPDIAAYGRTMLSKHQ